MSARNGKDLTDDLIAEVFELRGCLDALVHALDSAQMLIGDVDWSDLGPGFDDDLDRWEYLRDRAHESVQRVREGKTL